MVKHLHMFKDVRSKAEHGNQINCECVLQCGQFRYRYYWDWAKFPMKLQGCTVAGVACDSHNNVYAAVRAPGCPGIAKFAPDGTFLGYYGKGIQKGRPHGIYIDKEDHIWLTDDTCHVVYKFDQEDQVMLTLGMWGLGSDTGVDTTIDSHLRYLTIRRMAGPFNMPTGITEGAEGDIYISDGYGNAAVHRFDHQGELISSWGGPGNGEGEFNIPHGVCADRMGRVWTADRDNDRVQIFDPKGELLHIIDGLLYPAGLWNDGTYTYIAEMDGRISVYDMGFQLSAQLGYCASIFKAHSIGGDGDGNLYLGQFSSYRLPKLERIQ